MSGSLALPSRLAGIDPAGLARPLVMGIVNVTPDSFYSGSRAPELSSAVEAGLRMAEEGADILDVGGESTRPGSDPVGEEEEARRVLPVVEALAKKAGVPVSIDTSKPAVARRALDAGATVLNDVLALRAPGMPEAAVRYPVVVLMHMLGDSPKTMQADPGYEDVVEDVSNFFKERLAAFRRAGGEAGRVWLDPGLGFGKTTAHNLELLTRLEELSALGRPVLVGASRKSFVGRILGSEDAPAPAEERLAGSLAVAARAAEAGAACVRVHDVRATREALDVFARVRRPG